MDPIGTQQTSNTLLSNEKDVWEKELSDSLWGAVEHQQVAFGDVELVAKELLTLFNEVKSKDDYIAFLEKMKERFPFCEQLYNKYRAQNTASREKAMIDRLSSYIKTVN